MMVGVTDLFEGDVPAGLDRSLSIHGAISHGPRHFPSEWAAIEGSAKARENLILYICNPVLPDDGMMARIRGAAVGVVSQKGAALPEWVMTGLKEPVTKMRNELRTR